MNVFYATERNFKRINVLNAFKFVVDLKFPTAPKGDLAACNDSSARRDCLGRPGRLINAVYSASLA